MADTFARMRQLIGTTAEWTANDLIIGNGEFAVERLAGGSLRMKVGDGVNRYSTLPYFDPGVFSYVRLAGDTMTGPLIVPGVTINAGGLNVSAGDSAFTAPVNLGAAATAAEPPTNDNTQRVPTTHWVRGQMAGIITGLNYLGAWDAETNTPPLASGGLGVPTPERGDFYQVSVAGDTELDGNSEWAAGDFVAFNGIAWQRIPQPLNYDQIVAGLGFVPAPIASPAFTGNPTITTNPDPTDNDQSIPSTKWVNDRLTAMLSALVPAGTIVDYGGLSAPAGWLLCRGQSVTVAAYPALHAAIGYRYGGSAANFNVPDLGGRVTAGTETTATRLTTAGSGIDGATLGATGGAQSVILSAAQMPGHSHDVGSSVSVQAGGNYTVPALGPMSFATAQTGGNQAHLNAQPTMVMTKIIKT